MLKSINYSDKREDIPFKRATAFGRLTVGRIFSSKKIEDLYHWVVQDFFAVGYNQQAT